MATRSGLKLAKLRDRIDDSNWSRRLMGQLQFIYKMSEVKDNKFESILNKVLDWINKQINGSTITEETVLGAEDMIAHLSEEAKEYSLICPGHVHIDMNWMWRWDETVAITLDTFRTVLKLMKEYPEFKFSQSQASIYKIVEKYAPDMLEKIRARVNEGRWEITAATWVEADKNIPNGESMARHLLYTKDYLSQLFDLDYDYFNFDFEPDTFGHSRNVPEILNQGGVKYYYHCRGTEDYNLYRWQAPSGKSVIVHRDPYWYNLGIGPEIVLYLPEFCDKFNLKTMLKVYGVGDHGGGPTRRDLERVKEMNQWPVFPQIKFGTFREYFSRVEEVADQLPVVDDEVNFVFTGCYTSQARIKMANRYGENALNEAEVFNTLATLNQAYDYIADDYAEAWQNILFNQFHDILPGSGVIDTREHALGLFQETMTTASSRKKNSLEGLVEQIDTSQFINTDEDVSETISEGAGVGFGVDEFKISQTARGKGKTRIFHIFNSAPFSREAAAEITVWDWQGDPDKIAFRDENGELVEHQLLEDGFNNYWGHKYFKVLVKVSVAAGGYTTVILQEADKYHIETPFPVGPRVEEPETYILENDYLKVVFDPTTTAITSLYDKSNEEELIDKEQPSGIFRLIEEDDSKGMTSWRVGRYQKIENIDEDIKIKKVDYDSDNIRQSLQITAEFRSSKIKVEISLDDNSPQINYDVECDWQESGSQGQSVPQLSFYLPLAYNCQTYKYDIPFGTITRKGMNLDVPANSWVTGVRQESNKNSVMLITDSKYGFRSVNDSLSVTLLRSSIDPDPYPELGVHNFSFAICLVDDKTNKMLIDKSYSYNHPLTVISGNISQGELPLKKSFLELEDGSVAISAVKMPETGDDNECIIRLYETEGENTEAVINFFKQIEEAYFVDVNEQKVETDKVISKDDKQVRLEVAPFTVVNIQIRFSE